MHWLLVYDYVEDIVERRGPFRAEHLALAQSASERGELLMAGATGDPVDGALFVFVAESADAAEAFARNDPYVQNGLVTASRVVPWNVVVGGSPAAASGSR